jgi:hypothetical protein
VNGWCVWVVGGKRGAHLVHVNNVFQIVTSCVTSNSDFSKSLGKLTCNGLFSMPGWDGKNRQVLKRVSGGTVCHP